MKKINILSFLVILLTLFSSCKKDETKEYLSDTPTVPTLTAPANNLSIVLSKATQAQNFPKFTWTAANYGFKASIQYEIQVSTNADMSGAQILATRNIDSLSYTLTNLAFDQFMLASLYLTPNVPTPLYYRVIAAVAGLPSATYPAGGATSAINSMTVTPFDTPVSIQTWGIVGDATPNGWNGPDYVMKPTSKANTYTATVALTAGSIKFRFNNSWSINLGGTPNNLVMNGDNISIAAAGTYTITLTISQSGSVYTGKYTIVKK